MEDRIKQELDLLKKYYPDIKYSEQGRWVFIPKYILSSDLRWNEKEIDICFQIPIGYPGDPPYGFYIPAHLKCDDQPPLNASVPSNKPPFDGTWIILSWQKDNWFPTADIQTGSNLLNFTRTFIHRFQEGR